MRLCLCFRQGRPVLPGRLILQCPAKRTSQPSTSGRNKSWRWRRRKVSAYLLKTHIQVHAHKARHHSEINSKVVLWKSALSSGPSVCFKAFKLKDSLTTFTFLMYFSSFYSIVPLTTIFCALSISIFLFSFLPRVLFLSISLSISLALLPLSSPSLCARHVQQSAERAFMCVA